MDNWVLFEGLLLIPHGIGDKEVQADNFVNHDNNSELEDEEQENEAVENQEVADEGLMPISDDKSSRQYHDESGDGDSQVTNDESSDDDVNKRKKDGSRMNHEISSNLGPYWDVQRETESTPATDMVMVMVTDYSDLSAAPNTPQYGSRKGM